MNGSVENAECGVWKVRSVENAECGKCGVWKTPSVENAECGKCGVWKRRSVEKAECGKCRVWKMRSVENAKIVNPEEHDPQLRGVFTPFSVPILTSDPEMRLCACVSLNAVMTFELDFLFMSAPVKNLEVARFTQGLETGTVEGNSSERKKKQACEVLEDCSFSHSRTSHTR